VRMVTEAVFGVTTWSMYEENGRDALNSIFDARASRELYIVKTHERPLTDDPAIYLVRDGRACISSYFHYLNEVQGLPIPLETVIRGDVWPGSWSEHYSLWDPESRHNTLLLRYEEFSRDKLQLTEVLSDFLKLKQVGKFALTFRELKVSSPNFFRTGNNESSIAEIQPHLKQFEELHGPLMRRLGYGMSET
jgi:Sulfotransferase domain